MSAAKPAYRFRLAIILTIIMAMALGSFWLLEAMRRSQPNTPSVQRNTQPDYYVNNFNFTRVSETGLAQYNIAGEKMSHFPGDDSFEIERPIIHGLEPGQPPITIRADRARVEKNQSNIHMMGKVEVLRAPDQRTEQLSVKTEYLLLLPNEDIIQTDQHVDLVLGTSKLSSTGMVANHNTGQLRLLGKVRAVLPPTAS